MAFNPFTAEHEAFRRTVRQWVEKELTPHALAWDEAGIFPAEVFRKAGEMGLLGIRHSLEAGGAGLDYWYVVVLTEELVRSENAGVNMALLVQAEMATPIIDAIGTPEQKELFLEPAIRGEKIAALGISEPNAGSDVANIRTTARRDGDDYVINGSKMWITNGTRADFITLAVRTGEAGYGGISLVTFPTDVKGFSVAKKLEKVGNLSSDTAILYFEDCRIPRRFLLGEENAGFYQIMTNFQGERLVGALMANAGMERMVEQAMRYGREREAFGRPIGTFQVWRHKFVEHMTGIEAGRHLCYHATALFDDWLHGRGDTPPVREISMAKLYSGDLAQQVAYDCMQFFGGMGYVTETPIARAWRDVRLITIGGGTSEVMKEIIGKLSGL
ncbi:acyl-CoA dehydrogenase family protein [Vulgatibacter sp.]|uniref:acyl-CoA dehydrogenase family protein n=1 Tax=Vulgatibacter sp. TaxID=1971226 RepID=UPI0035698331